MSLHQSDAALDPSHDDDQQDRKLAAKPFSPLLEEHIVLGDPLCRSNRTTRATVLLRDVKDKFKTENQRRKRSSWIPKAIELFRQRLQQEFGGSATSPESVGQVFIKSTERAKNRLLDPDTPTHGYVHLDDRPLYGLAKNANDELWHFLDSRDAPTLEGELDRYEREVEKLRSNKVRPPDKDLDEFEEELAFARRRLQRVREGNILAKNLLEKMSLIKPLRQQWQVLKKQSREYVQGETSLAKENPKDESDQSYEPSMKKRRKTSSPVSSCLNGNFALIQPWHVVLGDPFSSAKRTTQANFLLSSVRAEYRDKHHGLDPACWIPEAIHVFYCRLRQELGAVFSSVTKGEVGMVLLRHSYLVVRLGRLAYPGIATHGYDGDAKAFYSEAGDANAALALYFRSSDSQTLGGELDHLQQEFARLRASPSRPPDSFLENFAQRLDWVNEKVKRAESGDINTVGLLNVLISPLKDEWNILIRASRPINEYNGHHRGGGGSDSGDDNGRGSDGDSRDDPHGKDNNHSDHKDEDGDCDNMSLSSIEWVQGLLRFLQKVASSSCRAALSNDFSRVHDEGIYEMEPDTVASA